VIIQTDDRVLYDVAPNSLVLKKSAKIPLFLLAWSAGLIGALNCTFLKVAGEILKINGKDGYNAFASLHLYIFLAIGIAGSVACICILNLVMRNYNQLEVMPIYQSAIIVNCLMSGMFILNEQRFYSTLNIIAIVLSCLLCVSGNFVILHKPLEYVDQDLELETTFS